ncbi:Retrovirus-related Pol polyprotein from transposon TNT 1-94 [Linum grandiflorum]
MEKLFSNVTEQGISLGLICIVLKNLEQFCLVSVKQDDQYVWHRKLGHVSIGILARLGSLDLVRGLPILKYEKDFFCDACAKGKHTRSSFKSKSDITTTRILELIHLDLFGPANTKSLGGKYYFFVLVDDFSRFSWVYFLTSKDEAFHKFKAFAKIIQNEKQISIIKIRSDNGGEFVSQDFRNFCEDLGIDHQLSTPRTPQQNGVVERKNRVLVDIARTMLNDFGLATRFWGEAVNTACYIINRALIRSKINKTPYELWKGKRPSISYFKPFGCKSFILNTKDHLGKFDSKFDEGIFVGYSSHSRAYRIYNKRTLKVEESIKVLFDEIVCQDSYLQDSGDLSFGSVNSMQDTVIDNLETQIEAGKDQLTQHNEAGNITNEINNQEESTQPSNSMQAPQHIQKRHPQSQLVDRTLHTV